MMQIIKDIAADTIANSKNVQGHTVDSLVRNWELRIEWLGLKVGGRAWRREMLNVARSGWIATTQKTFAFLAPSDETLSWGGFLGGEFVTTPEMTAASETAFYRRWPNSEYQAETEVA